MGYTVAGIQRNPVIQVWRKSDSQSSVYYNTSTGIAIDGALCMGGLRRPSHDTADEVFHCDLNTTNITVTVQPGDILGLKLSSSNSRLAFAEVTQAPKTMCLEQVSLLHLHSLTAFPR